jgi:DNA polymerase-3 subunit delta'
MPQLAPLFPWQLSLFEQLNASRARLPHAILLHGRSGLGKLHFARVLSQSLLCLNPSAQGHACQRCASCHWFHDDAHPDLRTLSPEQESEAESESESVKKKIKKKNHISILQVRDLSDFINLSSHNQKGLRIVLIHPAESLNVASANALLKMLEEPASNVIFILVAHQIHRLLPTILSRCHKIAMPIPDASTSLAWLNSQGIDKPQLPLAYFSDSPLHVIEQLDLYTHFDEVSRLLSNGRLIEPSVVSSKLISSSVESGITALQKWLFDLFSAVSGCEIRYHIAHTNALQQLASKVNLSALMELLKKTQTLKSLALHPLNHELQMECLLLEYTKIFSTK